ncbi:sensor histidine kinase [Thermoflavimicrobium daqui]|uniref:histidine kinase n=2 Tax=Thermoflavimicrobium daqui TaxID=2137476 RepID=A0A364K9Y8_9BACL|nr:sensor histidine kinase [Thermoflavimicrobium daqui]
MISTAVILVIMLEGIFPLFHLKQDDDILLAPMTMIISILLIAFAYGWYFGKPFFFLMKWIGELANGTYQEPANFHKLYHEKNGKLKYPYRLYQEVFLHMHALTKELKQAEKERKQLEEMKQNWAAGISHDLKTPLTYITGYSAMLLSTDHKWKPEEQIEFIQQIHQKSYHLQELISDLNLSFQMDYRKIPLNKVNHNIVEFVRRIIVDVINDPRAKDYHLDFCISVEKVDLAFDEKLLKRALVNLLMNSIIHNPKGTKITISVDVDSDEKKVIIIISDNGIGMDEQTVKHLFHKYYRGSSTTQSDEGSGLGMAITKQLILAHDGQIEVHSQPQVGTFFQIILPISLI